jgi:ubiquinone biosynthesis protein UbiJ
MSKMRRMLNEKTATIEVHSLSTRIKLQTQYHHIEHELSMNITGETDRLVRAPLSKLPHGRTK